MSATGRWRERGEWAQGRRKEERRGTAGQGPTASNLDSKLGILISDGNAELLPGGHRKWWRRSTFTTGCSSDPRARHWAYHRARERAEGPPGGSSRVWAWRAFRGGAPGVDWRAARALDSSKATSQAPSAGGRSCARAVPFSLLASLTTPAVPSRKSGAARKRGPCCRRRPRACTLATGPSLSDWTRSRPTPAPCRSTGGGSVR